MISIKNRLKSLLSGVVLFAGLVCGAHAQGVSNFYAAGGSYNPAASPKFALTAMAAHQMNTSGTYGFTVVDAITASDKTFNTNVGIGVAQKVLTIARHDVLVPTSLSVSTNGAGNVGWAYGTGAYIPFKVKDNWYVGLMARATKSSVSGGAGIQPNLTLTIGWGQ